MSINEPDCTQHVFVVLSLLWVTLTQKNVAAGDVGGVQAWWGGAVGGAVVEVVEVDVVFK